MKNKVLIGLFVGLGLVLMLFNPIAMGILAMVFWIYSGVKMWKGKRIFLEKMETELTEKRFKWLKVFQVIAVIFFPLSMVGIVMHNIQSSQSGMEESFYFILGIAALYVFILASMGGFMALFIGKQKSTISRSGDANNQIK